MVYFYIGGNMKENKKQKSFSTSETILLVLMASLVSYFIGHILVFDKDKKEVAVRDPYVEEFAKNYEYIVNNYYDKINRQDLINSAISGMLESLDDPYSVYMDEDSSDNFNITLNGSYKGLGVQIIKDESNGYILVTGVFKNSPASEAGIKAGDYIISANNIMTKDVDANAFSKYVRESNDKEFIMHILRGTEELDINIKRENVVLSSVTSEVYENNGKKVGYIYIGIFASNTDSQFKDELKKIKDQNIDSLIIDVRDNTGGHLTAVDGILDLFIDSKHIKYQFNQNGVNTKIRGTSSKVEKYNVVLIGNGNSASASEVLISSLRDNLGAKLIGTKTYGKGTVQELINLSDGNQYKITVRKWLTPNGTWINDTKGIIPDIEIELDAKYLETHDDKDDNQLQAAIEYLTK